MKIVVQYCGGCNPVIDRSGVVKELQLSLGPQTEFAYDLDSDYDFRLVIDGCNVGCRARLLCNDSKTIQVAGLIVQKVEVKKEKELPREIIKQIQKSIQLSMA